MSEISPHIASQLALSSYEIENHHQSKKLQFTSSVKKHFDFNSNRNVIHGTSGGLFWRKKPDLFY